MADKGNDFARKMIKFFVGGFALWFFAAFVMVFIGMCSTEDADSPAYAATAAEGLDLGRVGDLLVTAKDAEDLEKKLNDPNTKVNNLDLNEDGQVDYIKVSEFGDGTVKGFSLTTEPVAGEVQEVASIRVEKTGDDQGKAEVRGNESIYGPNHYHTYNHGPGMGTWLLMGYLFGSHSPYLSPYRYGYYPSYYRPYSVYPRSTYRGWGSSSRFRKSTSRAITNTNVTSPYKGRNAASVKAPLSNPTTAQRSFQARNPSRSVSSGGFGRSGGYRSSGRSGGFFGGGK